MNDVYIYSQDYVLVGLSHVIDIHLDNGTITNEDTKESKQAFAITAITDQIIENEPYEITLGFYFTEQQVLSVMENIVAWLNEKNDYHRVFRMPPIESGSGV